MVLPFGGMMMQGPPTEEVLKLLPGLKITVGVLAVAVILEFIAGYSPAAMTDLPTVWMGLLILRDMQRLNRCLIYFTLMAGMNLFYGALFLHTLLSAPFPGPANFLSSDCPPVTIQDHVFNCSWRTQLGDIAVVIAVICEAVCTVLGYKMFASTRRAMEENMLTNPMMGGGDGASLLPMYARGAGGMMGGAENAGMAGAQGGGEMNEQGRLVNPGGAAREVGGAPPGGFQHFSGQPHRLGDD